MESTVIQDVTEDASALLTPIATNAPRVLSVTTVDNVSAIVNLALMIVQTTQDPMAPTPCTITTAPQNVLDHVLDPPHRTVWDVVNMPPVTPTVAVNVIHTTQVQTVPSALCTLYVIINVTVAQDLLTCIATPAYPMRT